MSTAARPTARWTLAGLVFLLLVSFALRLWMASARLDGSQSFDERFSLRNVHGILVKGELRPSHTMYLGLSYYPQTAVLATSHALHRLTGWPVFEVLQPDGKTFTATAYFLCRLVNVIYAVLSLWLVFRIGRRLHSPELGLLAAALMGAVLRHLRSSTHFKPDILVVMLTTLVLAWTIEAVALPTLRRFLKVGAGIGLATATKYTGLASALPLTAGVLLFGRRDRRQWGWLVLAGLTSILTFVALNPYLGTVFHFIPKLINGYASHGTAVRSNHWVVLLREIQFLAEQPDLWVAPFVFLGIAWLTVRTLRRSTDWAPDIRAGWTVVLALLLGHTVLHAAGMTLFRAQNYMPVAPAAALIGAWGMIESWRWLARRLPILSRPAPAIAVWGAVAVALLARQFTQVYGAAVPTTWQVVQRTALGPIEGSGNPLLVFEKELGAFQTKARPGYYTGQRVDRLTRLRPEALDLADVEAFPARRLEGADRELYRARQAGASTEIHTARPFVSRGDAVVLLRHPWRQDGEAMALQPEPMGGDGTGTRFALDAGRLAGGAPGATYSLRVTAPREAQRRRWVVRFQPDGFRVRLSAVRVARRKQFLASGRFVLSGGETACEIPNLRPEQAAAAKVELIRWLPAERPERGPR